MAGKFKKVNVSVSQRLNIEAEAIINLLSIQKYDKYFVFQLLLL